MENAKKHTRTLGDIVRDLLSLFWTITEENDGVLDAELEEAVRGMEGEFVTKIDRCLMASHQLEAQAEHWKARAGAMLATSKSLNKRAEWLWDYVHRAMTIAQVPKVQTEHFPVVAVQKSPASVEIIDEAKFVEAYKDDIEMVEMRPHIHKSEVKRRLESKQEVVGAVLITDKTHLRVK